MSVGILRSPKMQVMRENAGYKSKWRIRGKFRQKSSARFLARTACLCVGTSFFAHKIDRRHDDLTAAADQKSLDLPSPRVGIWQSPYKVYIKYK
jgi:hypothetical protein